MWKRYGHHSLMCLEISNKINPRDLILFMLFNYLSYGLQQQIAHGILGILH